VYNFFTKLLSSISFKTELLIKSCGFKRRQAAFRPDEGSQSRKQKSHARQYGPSVALASQSRICIYLRTIVKVALLVTPLCEALMLALIFLLVVAVVMLNVAELVPAGTVTFPGTIAFVGLLLVSVTTKGLDVTLLSVTVPTELDPPTTVVGFKVKEESAAGTGALTVSVADLFTPA
jgi:hypothetical protein